MARKMPCAAARAKLGWPAMTLAYYMDPEITPARSLSPRGLKVVMGITLALAAIPMTTFMLLGAHLVLPFVGLGRLVPVDRFHPPGARRDGGAAGDVRPPDQRSPRPEPRPAARFFKGAGRGDPPGAQ